VTQKLDTLKIIRKYFTEYAGNVYSLTQVYNSKKSVNFFPIGIEVNAILIYVYSHSFPFPSWSLIPIPMEFHGIPTHIGNRIPVVISSVKARYWKRVATVIAAKGRTTATACIVQSYLPGGANMHPYSSRASLASRESTPQSGSLAVQPYLQGIQS